MDEFSLIRQHFAQLTPTAASVALGVGDDCALLRPPRGEVLAVTTDTLISGRHFPADTAARNIGWKSLAVSLSDLAAMGAKPRWFVLALSLSEEDEDWLSQFAEGLRALAVQSGIALVGGDTTRGPLSITITAIGSVPAALALRRSGARPGDLVCVTGTLGDAALGLHCLQEFESVLHDSEDLAQWEEDVVVVPDEPAATTLRERLLEWVTAPRPVRLSGEALVGTPTWTNGHQCLRARLERPLPRIEAGIALRGLAHAAIDISDGLAGDLAHILEASGVGAEIRTDALPMSPAFEKLHPSDERLPLQLAGGDDYELCVCLPPERLDEARARLGDLPLTEVGRITERRGLHWLDARGKQLNVELHGYDHFRH
jgi:thiamine-monophosphate kinase